MIRSELTFTPALVRRAAFAFVRRAFGIRALVCFGILILIVISQLVFGQRDWLSGTLFGATAVLLILVIGLYLLHYRRGLAKLRRMKQPHATLELTDAEFRVAADLALSLRPGPSSAASGDFRTSGCSPSAPINTSPCRRRTSRLKLKNSLSPA
jgi:hypothetical protein